MSLLAKAHLEDFSATVTWQPDTPQVADSRWPPWNETQICRLMQGHQRINLLPVTSEFTGRGQHRSRFLGNPERGCLLFELQQTLITPSKKSNLRNSPTEMNVNVRLRLVILCSPEPSWLAETPYLYLSFQILRVTWSWLVQSYLQPQNDCM